MTGGGTTGGVAGGGVVVVVGGAELAGSLVGGAGAADGPGVATGVVTGVGAAGVPGELFGGVFVLRGGMRPARGFVRWVGAGFCGFTVVGFESGPTDVRPMFTAPLVWCPVEIACGFDGFASGIMIEGPGRWARGGTGNRCIPASWGDTPWRHTTAVIAIPRRSAQIAVARNTPI